MTHTDPVRLVDHCATPAAYDTAVEACRQPDGRVTINGVRFLVEAHRTSLLVQGDRRVVRRIDYFLDDRDRELFEAISDHPEAFRGLRDPNDPRPVKWDDLP